MDSDKEVEYALPEDVEVGSDEGGRGEGDYGEEESNKEEMPQETRHYSEGQNPRGLNSRYSFKSPADPALPQDVSLIMELVDAHQVIGSLPPLDMAATEKRRQVEQSIRDRQSKDGEAVLVQSVKEELSSEESSSEEESSEEESSSEKEDKLMIDVRHEEPKSDVAGSIDRYSMDDEKERKSEKEHIATSFVSPRVLKKTHDTLDEEDDISAEPILSINEAPLRPVPQPPMTELPEGEELSLAGDVVTWMKDKRVEAWKEEEKLEEEAKGVFSKVSEMISDDMKDLADNKVKDYPREQVKEQVMEKVGSVDGLEAGKIEAERTITKMGEGQPDGKHEDTVRSDKNPTPASFSLGNKRQHPSSSSSGPRFSSAGTVVIRAMQSRPGSGDEGWLEEGSVVTETFGPLTSPFYQIRLPPPPFPYPSPDSLKIGTKVFFPKNPQFRAFVNMHAIHDPRFKGSDASNLYDEEIGEEEQEWSDDEAEAEAKKRRKNSRAGSRLSTTSRSDLNLPRLGGVASLPQRPHFDYQPPDSTYAGSETGSLYGGNDGVSMYAKSEAGTSTSGRERPMPAPYDIDDIQIANPSNKDGSHSDHGDEVDHDGGEQHRDEPIPGDQDRKSAPRRRRGRTGGDRGRGKGYSDRDWNSSGRPRHLENRANDRGASILNGGRPISLPAKPISPVTALPNQIQWQNPPSTGYSQHIRPPPLPRSHPGLMSPYPPENSPSMHYPLMRSSHIAMPQQIHSPSHQHPFGDDQYHPSHPSAGMGFRPTPPISPSPRGSGPMYSPTHLPQQPQQYLPPSPRSQGPSPSAPAINPRFAAQYQQMMYLGGGFQNWHGQGGLGQQ